MTHDASEPGLRRLQEPAHVDAVEVLERMTAIMAAHDAYRRAGPARAPGAGRQA